MSQENVEVIWRLLPGPQVDIAQAVRRGHTEIEELIDAGDAVVAHSDSSRP